MSVDMIARTMKIGATAAAVGVCHYVCHDRYMENVVMYSCRYDSV